MLRLRLVMAALEECRDDIILMFNTGMTHVDIAANMSRMGVQRGCSLMSVRRFCEQNNLSRWGHSNSDLEMAVFNFGCIGHPKQTH